MDTIEIIEQFKYVLCVQLFLEFKFRDSEAVHYISKQLEWEFLNDKIVYTSFAKDSEMFSEFCLGIVHYVIMRQPCKFYDFLNFIEEIGFSEVQWDKMTFYI